MLLLIVVLGIYPNIIFKITDLRRAPQRRSTGWRGRCSVNPHVDFHALAPELILTATIVVVLVADLFWPDRVAVRSRRGSRRSACSPRSIPVDHAGGRRHRPRRCSAARSSSTTTRSRSRASSSSSRTSSLLMSVDYIGDGDYYQGEFYFLLLTSVLGMIVMASARDLITLFVALETISIPTFVLAGVAQARLEVERSGVKYYLIGVLSSAVMLYGMSLDLRRDRRLHAARRHLPRTSSRTARRPLLAVAIFLSLVGFAFKVERGAVPLLGARHLRRRAHAGHRVPVGRVEGRRLRRAAHASSTSASSRRRTRGSRCSGCSRRRR